MRQQHGIITRDRWFRIRILSLNDSVSNDAPTRTWAQCTAKTLALINITFIHAQRTNDVDERAYIAKVKSKINGQWDFRFIITILTDNYVSIINITEETLRLKIILLRTLDNVVIIGHENVIRYEKVCLVFLWFVCLFICSIDVKRQPLTLTLLTRNDYLWNGQLRSSKITLKSMDSEHKIK